MLRSPLLITVALLTVSTCASAAKHASTTEDGHAKPDAPAAEQSAAKPKTAAAEQTGNGQDKSAPESAASASNKAKVPTIAELDKASQALVSEIVQLQAQLLAVKRDIRYPAVDRWTVFVTRKAVEERQFTLESIRLVVDGRPVATEQYSANERRALRAGGADRLHLGTLRRGRHHATVTITGQWKGKPFRRTQTLVVDKPGGPRIMALQVHPRVATRSDAPAQPGVTVRHLDDLR